MVLQLRLQLESLAAAVALERLVAVPPLLVSCQDSLRLEPAATVVALVAFHPFLFWGSGKVDIGISLLDIHFV